MDKIRLGFIGIGEMARRHMRVFNEKFENVEVASLTDPDPETLEKAVAEIQGEADAAPTTYKNHLEMFETEKLDGVVVASPPTMHYGQIVDALENNCHILVEKPMVTSAKHARKIVDLSRDRKRIVSVAFPALFTPEFEYARSLIKDDRIGEIRLFHGIVASNWMSVVEGTWRSDPDISGGGYLYDHGSHVLNALLYLTGLTVEKVNVFLHQLDLDVDVLAAISMRMENGAVGSVVTSGDCPFAEQQIFIQGVKGGIRGNPLGGSLKSWIGDKEHLPEMFPARSGIHENFINCILGKEDTPSPATLGWRHAMLMDTIYQSATEGAATEINNGKED